MKKIYKKLILFFLLVIMSNMLSYFGGRNINADVSSNNPVKISVILRKGDDPYGGLIKESFEKIQKDNEGKVEFHFYDAKGDQLLQDKLVDSTLNENNSNAIFIQLEDEKHTKYIVDKVKAKNIPIVFYSSEPPNIDVIKSYNKAYFIGTDAEQGGRLQGKILVDLWHKNNIDKNGDNILQYVMLMGIKNNLEAIGRTKYSVLSINDSGIKTEEIALKVCNWDRKTARDAMEQIIIQKGDKIEAIISNNDAMALGAIEVLQKYGYNKGSGSKIIPVVGVDGIPEALQLISKGIMTGTVIQDAYSMAKAVYDIGMNLVNNNQPLDGTQYKVDETGVAIRIPYKEYIETQ